MLGNISAVSLVVILILIDSFRHLISIYVGYTSNDTTVITAFAQWLRDFTFYKSRIFESCVLVNGIVALS